VPALPVEPRATPPHVVSLSRLPNTAPTPVDPDAVPAACVGLRGLKFAPLFVTLTDYGGLGANHRLAFGRQNFKYKAWDGRPKSKWDFHTTKYPALALLPSYGSRDVSFRQWTAEEKRKYKRESRRCAIWYLERVQETVRAGACTLSMTGSNAHVEGVCEACSLLLKNRIFRHARRDRTKAVNRIARLDETDRQAKAYKQQAHTPGHHLDDHRALLQKYQHLPAVAELSQTLEVEGDDSLAPFVKLQAFAARGWLKGKEVMVGLIECLVQRVEVEQSDNPARAKHGLDYPQNVKDFSILLRARGGTSASTYCIASSVLPLPHARTVKRATAKAGTGFALSGTDTERIAKYWAEIVAKKLDHHPLAMMQDCTKSNTALTHSRVFEHLCGNGHILGSTFELEKVAVVDEKSPASITAAVSDLKAIASQVRAVLIKLPLDGDPGIVIHLSPT
ncbi:hypothetical protein P7C70_g9410, partial [Phenoliferia sp. Uapishka_3]